MSWLALTFERLVTARTGYFLASSATFSTASTFSWLCCFSTWTVLLILVYRLLRGLAHRRLDHDRLDVLVPVGELLRHGVDDRDDVLGQVRLAQLAVPDLGHDTEGAPAPHPDGGAHPVDHSLDGGVRRDR